MGKEVAGSSPAAAPILHGTRAVDGVDGAQSAQPTAFCRASIAVRPNQSPLFPAWRKQEQSRVSNTIFEPAFHRRC
jgi:hypothetical protein